MESNDEIKLTRKAIAEMAKQCPEADKILRAGFPEVFKQSRPFISGHVYKNLQKDYGGAWLFTNLDDEPKFILIDIIRTARNKAWIGSSVTLATMNQLAEPIVGVELADSPEEYFDQ